MTTGHTVVRYRHRLTRNDLAIFHLRHSDDGHMAGLAAHEVLRIAILVTGTAKRCAMEVFALLVAAHTRVVTLEQRGLVAFEGDGVMHRGRPGRTFRRALGRVADPGRSMQTGWIHFVGVDAVVRFAVRLVEPLE